VRSASSGCRAGLGADRTWSGVAVGDVVEDLLDQYGHVRIIHGVDVLGALGAGGDQPGQAQLREVLADRGDLRPDRRGEGGDIALGMVQQPPRQPQPDRRREQVEHRRGVVEVTAGRFAGTALVRRADHPSVGREPSPRVCWACRRTQRELYLSICATT